MATKRKNPFCEEVPRQLKVHIGPKQVAGVEELKNVHGTWQKLALTNFHFSSCDAFTPFIFRLCFQITLSTCCSKVLIPMLLMRHYNQLAAVMGSIELTQRQMNRRKTRSLNATNVVWYLLYLWSHVMTVIVQYVYSVSDNAVTAWDISAVIVPY